MTITITDNVNNNGNHNNNSFSTIPQWYTAACAFLRLHLVTERGSGTRWPHQQRRGSIVRTPLVTAIRHCRSSVLPSEVGKKTERIVLQEAEVLLRQRFGSYAKLVLQCHSQNVTQTPQNESGEEEEEEAIVEEEPVAGTASREGGYKIVQQSQTQPQPQQLQIKYRASATCRLLGFPVELASAIGHHPDDLIRLVLHEALESDVTFIQPSSRTPGSSRETRGHGSGRVSHSRYQSYSS